MAAPTLTSISPTVGPVGTSVNLVGSGFTSVAKPITGVTLNSVAVKYTIHSDTLITVAKIPATTSGNFAVSNADGASAGKAFVVDAVQHWTGPLPVDAFAQYPAANVNSVSTVPEIVAAADVTATAGHVAGYTMSVVPLAGQGKTYQWYKDGVKVAGATSESYLYTSGASALSAVFQCAVSSTAGTIWSNTFTITLS